MTREKGFTLLELVLVLVISAGVIAMIAPMFDYVFKQPDRLDKAQSVATKAIYVSDTLTRAVREADNVELLSPACIKSNDSVFCFQNQQLIERNARDDAVLVNEVLGQFTTQPLNSSLVVRFEFSIDSQAFENLVVRGR